MFIQMASNKNSLLFLRKHLPIFILVKAEAIFLFLQLFAHFRHTLHHHAQCRSIRLLEYSKLHLCVCTRVWKCICQTKQRHKTFTTHVAKSNPNKNYDLLDVHQVSFLTLFIRRAYILNVIYETLSRFRMVSNVNTFSVDHHFCSIQYSFHHFSLNEPNSKLGVR